MMRCKSDVQVSTPDIPSSSKFSNKTLTNFIGIDSWTLFGLFRVEAEDFLVKPVKEWDDNPIFLQLNSIVKQLKVVNDSAERILGMVTDFHMDKITRNEDQRQYLLQVQKELRHRHKSLLLKPGKTERCTKRIIKEMQYD